MTVDMETLHARLLEMMKEFHRVCQENGLRYYLVGGSALGARRHGGFIPWDDDMDVAMPREDYRRLKQIAGEVLPDHLELQDYDTRANRPMHFAKLIDARTTLIEPSFRNFVEGVYIDVFPLDGAFRPGSLRERLRFGRVWFYKAVCMYHCTSDKKSGPVKELLRKWARTRNLRAVHERMERLITRVPYRDSVWCVSYLGAWGAREYMPKVIFGTPVLYAFEDAEFCCPERIDAHLTRLYGDFMTPPPEAERTPRHDYEFLSLDIPYREYMRGEDRA